MVCENIQARLFERSESDQDRRHVESCPECAAFAAAILPAPLETDDSLQSILSVTQESACDQAEQRLPDWIDGALQGLDAELLDGHLRHCSGCEEFATILRQAELELPTLIESECDESFVAAVVAATPLVEPTLTWGQRFDRWVAATVSRPRIAWEGAYLATACLALLFIIPGSPFADASTRALQWSQGEQLERPFVAFGEQLTSGSKDANLWVRRAQVESGIAVKTAKRELGTLWTRLASTPTTTQTPEEGRGNGEIK